MFKEVKADMTLHAPHLHWSHSGHFDSLDHASVRLIFNNTRFIGPTPDTPGH